MLNKEAGDGGMVRNLFHEDFSSVLSLRLVSLAEDWIKRLLEAFVIHSAGHLCTDQHLNALNRVCLLAGHVEVEGQTAEVFGDHDESRLM